MKASGTGGRLAREYGRWLSSFRLMPIMGAAVLLALAAVLVLTASASAPAATFPDVPADHPYAAAIADLAEREIILGFSDGTFGPDKLVLRQQFAKMIVLTLGYSVSEQDLCPFSDVEDSGAESLYPDNYVAVAAARGITLGTGPQTFSPYHNISRFQVITMMVRAVDDLYPSLLSEPPPSFTAAWNPDQSPDHGQNARRAEYHGLLAGLPLPTLDPWGAMPRGEVAQVLHNLLMKVAPPSTTTTPTETTTTTEPETIPIGVLKGPEWESYVGLEVTIEGIFVRDPLPMLVTRLDVVTRDTPMPEDAYILLSGPAADGIPSSTAGGAVLKVRGRVDLDIPEEAQGSDPLVGSAWDPAKYVKLADIDYRIQDRLAVYDPQLARIPVVEFPNPDPKRFAVLFSGGIDKANNHIRYWNNLKFMYSTLVGPLGFSKNNIAVLYADGKALDTTMPVQYAATQQNLAKVFDLLRERSSLDDLIFVYTTNHGGGFNTSSTGAGCFYGGHLDVDGDEPGESISEASHLVDVNQNNSFKDFFAWDECLNCWKGDSTTASGEILDDDLQAIFGNLAFNRMVVVMGQCFSGGLIHDVAQGGNRIIISAAGEHEFAWSTSSKSYSEFVYHFTCAVRGADPSGTTIDADTNKNGEVSMVEAFNYARTHDTTGETPQYEDSGDGIAHSGAMPGGGEGTLGGNTSLEP